MKPFLPRNRAGITLVEILISIMIMLVGLVSLASLFPVGLERIRRGQRDMRSALLVNSAISDLQARNMLGSNNFLGSGWYFNGGFLFDPFIQDTKGSSTAAIPIYSGWGLSGKFDPFNPVPYRSGTGLPVCYDPLWWAAVNVGTSNVSVASGTGITPATFDGRLGLGINFIPGAPSAFGLSRLTNFTQFTDASGNAAPSIVQAFTSIDDPVLMEDGTLQNGPSGTPADSPTGSPILPILNSAGDMTFDWTYSWFFTGQRLMSEGNVYAGDIVVCNNRQFGLDPSPVGGPRVPAGERVVEAIFAYGSTADATLPPFNPASTVGYSAQTRTVKLRWKNGLPDPELRVGGWFADVTYERDLATSDTRSTSPLIQPFPMQRCHWYRCMRRTDIQDDPNDPTYRFMVVTTDQPVLARTLLTNLNSAGQPAAVYGNAALIMPSVVNVYPNKVITAR